MRIVTYLSFLIILAHGMLTFSQTINIHSIASLRQTSFDNGYTLDGDHMAASRAKLFNPENFSDTGVYRKNVALHSAYYTSGSLEQITLIEGIDIFFFGSFIPESGGLVPFTQAEKDSLYAWSMRGGKLIIAEQGIPGGNPYQNLSEKWGYRITWSENSTIIPVEKAKDNRIFNGPFGTVDHASMGGSAQGYLSGTNEDISVLGTNQAGQSTLIIDCRTRDLICADVDAYTDLGGLSSSDEILNEQDRFWVNTIAFMDSIGDPPQHAVIQYDGTDLYTSDYYGYQWLLNWDNLEGTDTSAIVPITEGYYRVVVEDNIGCKDTSDIFVFGMPLEPVIKCPENISVPTDPSENFATLTLALPQVFDSDGIASIICDATDSFPIGVTTVTWTITDSAGYISVCTQSVTVFDNERPTLICPSNISVSAETGQNYVSLSLDDPVTTDNVFVYSLTNNAPDIYPIGTTLVLWTVSDSSGNRASCGQIITVTDNENPHIECPPTIEDTLSPGSNTISVDLGQSVTSDNDRVAVVSNNAPALFHAGTTVVTWTATDASGNHTSCEQDVTIAELETVPETVPSFTNIITPNGDGKNDFFIIENLPDYSEFIIFDRTDKVLYQTDNYLNNWHGTDMQGNILANGTYWYILNTPDGKWYSGYVIVKRE